MPKCKFVNANRRRCASNAVRGCEYCVSHRGKALEDNDLVMHREEEGEDEGAMLPMPPVGAGHLFNEALVEENMKLKTDIERLTNELNRLTVAFTAVNKKMEEGAGGRKKARARNPPSEKKVWRKAKFMFYGEMKNNMDILTNILGRMKTSGLIQEDAGVKDIPWLNVKKVSDHMFDAKDAVEKKMYYDVAYDVLVKKLKVNTG